MLASCSYDFTIKLWDLKDPNSSGSGSGGLDEGVCVRTICPDGTAASSTPTAASNNHHLWKIIELKHFNNNSDNNEGIVKPWSLFFVLNFSSSTSSSSSSSHSHYFHPSSHRQLPLLRHLLCECIGHVHQGVEFLDGRVSSNSDGTPSEHQLHLRTSRWKSREREFGLVHPRVGHRL